MNGQISAALVVMGAMVLFVGSAVDRTGEQTSAQTELNAAVVQDNGQQASPPLRNPGCDVMLSRYECSWSYADIECVGYGR